MFKIGALRRFTDTYALPIVDHCRTRFDQLAPTVWRDESRTPIEGRSQTEMAAVIRSLRLLVPVLQDVSKEVLEMVTAFAASRGIEAITKHEELLACIDRLIMSWHSQLMVAGVHTLDSVKAGGEKLERDPLLSSLDSNYTVPTGIKNFPGSHLFPKDTSQKLRFHVSTEDQVSRILDKAQLLPCRVFVNLLVPVATAVELARRPSLAMGYLWARSLGIYSPSERQILDKDWQNPFQILLPFARLLRLLCEPKRSNLSLKIDERCLDAPDVEMALLSTGYPVFVTAYDTSAANLLRVARSCANKHGTVNISVIPLGEKGSNVVLVSNSRDRKIWASPLALLAWNQICAEYFLPEPNVFKVRGGFPEATPIFGSSINLADLTAAFVVSTFGLKKERIGDAMA
jgi:hypothetical protein